MGGGHIRKHWAFLVPRSGAAHGEPSPLDADLAPCPNNVSTDVLSILQRYAGRNVTVETDVQGEPLTRIFPPTAAVLLGQLDCRASLARLSDRFTQRGMTHESFRLDWLQLY